MNAGEESVLRVLFAGNDSGLARELGDAIANIKDVWITLEQCDSYIGAMECMKRGAYDLCVSAEPLQGGPVLEFIGDAVAASCRTPILFITTKGEQAAIAEAMKAGAADYLVRGEITPPMWERSLRYSVERRHMEEEIQELRYAAGESARAKSQFISNVTHEFKTPLNAVIGLIDLVLDSDLTHNQHENLMLARFSADSLLQLMTNIINCSSLQSGNVISRNRFFNLRQLLAKVLLPLNLAAEQKSLQLSSCLGPGVPELLFSDPERLTQVVTHLIDNAIKFTDHGEVVLSVAVSNADGADVTLQWTVSDTGPGIPAERIDNVFDPFTQVDGSTTRRHGGAGLGLSVVRNLVSLLGGKIWVESEVGSGARFHFTIRTTPSDADLMTPGQLRHKVKDKKPELQAVQRGRILAADDSLVNQVLLTDMLQQAGYQVTVVDNGRKAVETTGRESFKAVFMDILMPEMDGYEAVRCIREREEVRGGHLPIFALTANDDQSDRERCRESGFDGYLTKPFRESDLLGLLEKHVYLSRDDSLPSAIQKSGSDGPDLGLLFASLGGDPKVFSEVLSYFVQEGAAQLHSIRRGLAAVDEKLIEQSAHKLKGMAANIGATRLADDAFRIQLAVRKGDFETPKELVKRLEKMIAAIPGEMETLADC